MSKNESTINTKKNVYRDTLLCISLFVLLDAALRHSTIKPILYVFTKINTKREYNFWVISLALNLYNIAISSYSNHSTNIHTKRLPNVKESWPSTTNPFVFPVFKIVSKLSSWNQSEKPEHIGTIIPYHFAASLPTWPRLWNCVYLLY